MSEGKTDLRRIAPAAPGPNRRGDWMTRPPGNAHEDTKGVPASNPVWRPYVPPRAIPGSGVAARGLPPLGLRAPAERSGTARQAHLRGRNLSEPKGVACESCHDRKRAYQGDNRSPIPGVAVGSRPGEFGNRKPPTIMYAAYSPSSASTKTLDGGVEKLEARGGLFWDGRAADLVDQPSGPADEPARDEQSLPRSGRRESEEAAYAPMMTTVFGPDAFADPKAAFQRVTQSLAAYESSGLLAPFSSRFDDNLRGAEPLTPLEARGWRCSSIPSAAIASPAMPSSRSRRIRATGCSPTSPTSRWASRATRRFPPTPTRRPSISACASARASRRSCRRRSRWPRCAAPSRSRPCATSRCARPTSTMARSPRCATRSPSTPPATATRSAGIRR